MDYTSILLVTLMILITLDSTKADDSRERSELTTPSKTTGCIYCFVYWSKEECNSKGMDQVEATCDRCSACVPRPGCVNCFVYWSKEQCNLLGMDQEEATCHKCSRCVPRSSRCINCTAYWSKEYCNSIGKDQVDATCQSCSYCIERKCNEQV